MMESMVRADEGSEETLELPRPDDWHVHFRDGAEMEAVAHHTARVFGRALVMPNLRPPVTTVAAALAYRERILAAVRRRGGAAARFFPVMTLYLTEESDPREIDRAAATEGLVRAVKLYPAGATTNAEMGVQSVERVFRVLERMEKQGVVLCVHGEVSDRRVDVFDREAVFVERVLAPLVARFPGLKVVLEHVTTAEGVAFVQETPPTVAATITAHHLLYSRNALFEGGVRPHFYCLPVLKRERHREALLAAAVGGSGKFFLGSDSAPHPRSRKEGECGCAGCFTAHAALPLYAEAFASVGALGALRGFASEFGARFYGFPVSEERVRLVRRSWEVPVSYDYLPGDPLIPLRAGERLEWFVEVGDDGA
ncbi:MAG: dihydroorotase [Hydrogenophilus sp.]|nr:dihydroorotase [Hydrogenophilus sp.]